MPAPDDQTAAALSQYAYQVSQSLENGTPLPTPGEWDPTLKDYSLLLDGNGVPVTSPSFQLPDGFAAVALINNNTGEIAIAFEGSLTGPAGFFQWSGLADGTIAAGGIPQAYSDADAFAQRVETIAL